MEKPVLTFENLSKFYTSAHNVVMGLNGINLSFSRGEFVAVTGESGSGKSTLAHVAAGILNYESGELLFEGNPTSHFDAKDWEKHRRDRISFISQSYGILLSASVMENVVSALRLSGIDKKDARRKAKAILEKVELWELRSRRAAKLSSGQKQRLSIARALAKPAPILIADEPTGNLDPENSAKIIKLLAEAAKDRLVLLITHDFFEAEDYVTRRISLKDGRVVMDAPMRPVAQPAPLPAPVKNKKPLSGYVSRLQLAGRPVWGSFVLLFFALTAFAVFAFLGTFITAWDDTNTRIYENDVFLNGDPNRIVVQRADGAYLTEEDYAAIVNVKHVAMLEKHGFLADVLGLYLDEVHYRVAYFMENIGSSIDPVYVQRQEIRPLVSDVFAKTIPVLPKGKTFLSAGRLPENVNEAVIAGNESQIGQTYLVYITDQDHWALGHYISYEVTIVGVTNHGEGIYLHDDIGRVFSHNNPWDGREYGRYVSIPNMELAEGTCRCSKEWGLYDGSHWGFLTAEGEWIDLTVIGTHDFPKPSVVEVSKADFDKITPACGGTQASVTLTDYAYTSRVLSALQDKGYIAVSPFRLGATSLDPELATQRIQTLIICAAALALVVVLQVIVLRALFGSETENYKLLANIGLTCATAKRSLLWQILLFTAIGQAVAAGGVWICCQKGVERIISVVKYLPGDLMALLSGVHLAAALLAALWLGRVIRKRVYPESARKDDIAIDEEVAV